MTWYFTSIIFSLPEWNTPPAQAQAQALYAAATFVLTISYTPSLFENNSKGKVSPVLRSISLLTCVPGSRVPPYTLPPSCPISVSTVLDPVPVPRPLAVTGRDSDTACTQHCSPHSITLPAPDPQELVYAVVEKTDETEVLETCSLVSTSFCEPSQRILLTETWHKRECHRMARNYKDCTDTEGFPNLTCSRWILRLSVHYVLECVLSLILDRTMDRLTLKVTCVGIFDDG
ncbi:hypothetical protein B0H19DRAFT_1271349 [Mycena capillaripes]|nr:hypothetical protein B0H19DRAFT_1271349 [Mycena capillaripes]